MAGIKNILPSLNKVPVLTTEFNRTSPIATAEVLINIPVINIRWVGLRNPSTPKVSCQIKSLGPDIIDKADPIMSNLNDMVIPLLFNSIYFINMTHPMIEEIDKMPIPA